MTNFQYHPDCINPDLFDPEWLGERVKELLYGKRREYTLLNPQFGIDRQYDRTVDEDGDPGEYIQVWMSWEEPE